MRSKRRSHTKDNAPALEPELSKTLRMTFTDHTSHPRTTRSVAWEKHHGAPVSLFAPSASQTRGAKWSMDTRRYVRARIRRKARMQWHSRRLLGITGACDTLKYHTDEINKTVEPFVLDETPLEMKCMRMEFLPLDKRQITVQLRPSMRLCICVSWTTFHT